MKKMSMLVLALFLLEGTGQIMNGMGQLVGGTMNTVITAPMAQADNSDTARWAGHYDYVEQGNDASGMSASG